MRFHAVERVSVADSERVLTVLEHQLRRRAGGGVEREGSRIVLTGLGPSPRTMNPRDRAVIDVRVEEGATLIEAEVSFQASSLLGPVGQEDVVRGKLMRLLGAARQQMEEEQDWAEVERRERLEDAQGGPSSPARIYTGPKRVEEPSREQAADRMAQEQAVSSGAAVADESKSEREEAAAAPDEPEPNRPWMRWAAIAACVVAIVPFAWRLRPSQQAAPVIDLTQEVTGKPARQPVPEGGPEGALRQWELAQSSRDAAAQAAYYAVPVEQYLWRRNVSRRDLEALKQQEISRRHGAWTMKAENVAIRRRGDEAEVSLVKHILEQPQGSGRARERFIPSQLTLKNSLGIWWITSERDIYPKKVAAVSDEDSFDPNEGETPDWAKPAPPRVAGSATPSSSVPSAN